MDFLARVWRWVVATGPGGVWYGMGIGTVGWRGVDENSVGILV